MLWGPNLNRSIWVPSSLHPNNREVSNKCHSSNWSQRVKPFFINIITRLIKLEFWVNGYVNRIWYYLIDLKLLHAVPRWKIQSLHYITNICPIPDTQIQRFCCCANSEKPNKSFSVNFHWMWILTQLKLSHISSVVEWDIGIAFGPNNVFKYFSLNNFAVFDSLAKNVPLQCKVYIAMFWDIQMIYSI